MMAHSVPSSPSSAYFEPQGLILPVLFTKHSSSYSVVGSEVHMRAYCERTL